MDARAERMDAELTRRIDARSAELERRVDALCAQVQALHALQAALEYRFEGERLVMLAPAAEGANAPSGASAADAPHD